MIGISAAHYQMANGLIIIYIMIGISAAHCQMGNGLIIIYIMIGISAAHCQMANGLIIMYNHGWLLIRTRYARREIQTLDR